MDLNDMTELDRMIEDALKSEPVRPVPSGFHRRVEDRVRVVALASRERRGFHSRVAVSLLLVAVLAFTVVLVPVLAFYQGWTYRALPGAMGYFDYLTVFVAQSWGQILLALGAGAGIAAAAALVVMAVPMLRRKRAAKQH